MLFHTPELTEGELEVIRRIDRTREAIRDQLPEQRRWVGLLRRVMLARAIRGSNSIEGYNVSLDDAVAAVAGEEPLDAEHESWMAVLGYRDALTYVLQLADDPHFELNETLIRSLHYMMLKYALDKSPGRWRPGSVYVIDERIDEIVYTGPDALEVPDLIGEFVEDVSVEDNSIPAMVRAAMAHLNLVMIHPFRDGNGRMARCIQTLVLAREGILSPPFASIEEYLGQETEAYYEVLAAVGNGSWQPERDARPWIRFVLTAHHKQAQIMSRRAEEAERRWDLLTDEARRLGLPERAIPALFNASMGFRMRNPHYRELAGVNVDIAGRDLKVLSEARLLVAVGERRGRFYVASERLKQIDQAARSIRKALVDPFDLIGETIPLGL